MIVRISTCKRTSLSSLEMHCSRAYQCCSINSYLLFYFSVYKDSFLKLISGYFPLCKHGPFFWRLEQWKRAAFFPDFLPRLSSQSEEAQGELMIPYSSQPKEDGHPFHTCLDSFYESVFSINAGTTLCGIDSKLWYNLFFIMEDCFLPCLSARTFFLTWRILRCWLGSTDMAIKMSVGIWASISVQE